MKRGQVFTIFLVFIFFISVGFVIAQELSAQATAEESESETATESVPRNIHIGITTQIAGSGIEAEPEKDN